MVYFCVKFEALNFSIKMIKLKFRFKSKAFMQKIQRGFTLIELVVVIVVLGILSAVAVPKYIDYKESAGAAAVKGAAGALAAAAAANYAAKLAGMSGGVSVTTCGAVKSLLTGSLPASYTVAAVTPGTNGVVASTDATTGVITPAVIGICTVSSTEFVATTTFPYTPI